MRANLSLYGIKWQGIRFTYIVTTLNYILLAFKLLKQKYEFEKKLHKIDSVMKKNIEIFYIYIEHYRVEKEVN